MGERWRPDRKKARLLKSKKGRWHGGRSVHQRVKLDIDIDGLIVSLPNPESAQFLKSQTGIGVKQEIRLDE